MQIEKLSTISAILGESPFWSREENAVWWVDIEAGRIIRTHAETGETLGWETGELTGCIVPEASGKIVAGMVSGLFLFDPQTGNFSRIAANQVTGTRFNDGITDPKGRLIAGIMQIENEKPLGVLYSIDADLNFHTLYDGLYTPNGLAVDPARGRLYFSDSHPLVQTIWTCDYDVETGMASNRREFAKTRDFDGRPDGAFVDVEGNYWMAGVGGGACLWKFSPDGTRETIALPISEPTKPIFDGNGNLYVTSKRESSGLGGYLAKASGGPKGEAAVPFRLSSLEPV